MARRPKYLADTERPISVSLRIPRDLYDKAQHLAHVRRATFTEIVVEGLRLRLDAPQDTRDILASQDTTVTQGLAQYIDARIQTVIQELEAMIDVRISAALATEGYTCATAPSPATAIASELILPNDENITVTQDRAATLAQIAAWRQDRLSYEAIAKQLNADGTPTFSGKGTWNKGTVMKQLARQ